MVYLEGVGWKVAVEASLVEVGLRGVLLEQAYHSPLLCPLSSLPGWL